MACTSVSPAKRSGGTLGRALELGRPDRRDTWPTWSTTFPAPLPAHLRNTTPSPWVARFAPLATPGGAVLDLACGNGRHGRLFLDGGHPVTFIDRTVEPLNDLADNGRAIVVAHDLEAGAPWPFNPESFAAVVVTNYLYRPLMADLIAALAPGGVLIYETFARGQERFSRPRNPDHLLKAGELLDLARDHGLQVVAFEQGRKTAEPLPGIIQRLCAVKDAGDTADRPLEPDRSA